MVKNELIESISLDGGTLCLDYVNTVRNRKSEPLPDYLQNVTDLLTWGERLGLIDPKTSHLLVNNLTGDPQKAIVLFKDAISVRELLYRLFYSIATEKKINKGDLEHFNRLLPSAYQHLQVKNDQGIFKEDWSFSGKDLSNILAPVVKDAHDLLLSHKPDRIRECPNCGWLFLDTSKNGKRRWCSMKSCGSSVKALEWYRRQKK